MALGTRLFAPITDRGGALGELVLGVRPDESRRFESRQEQFPGL